MFIDGLLFGMGFWAVSYILFGLFILSLVTEWVFEEPSPFAIGGLVLYIVGLEFFTDIPVFTIIYENPFSVIVFLATYIAIGGAYTGFWRWPRYLADRKESIQKSYGDFTKGEKSKIEGKPEHEIRDMFKGSIWNKYRASDNIDTLVAWVVMWPFSLLVELLHRPFRFVYNFVWDTLGNWFNRIANKQVDNAIDDIYKN